MSVDPSERIYFDTKAALPVVQRWKDTGLEVVFTNGCFDILHPGHIKVLQEASMMGDKLIVGLNSDLSVKKLKGDKRPVFSEKERAMMLATLASVDMVVIFEEETPYALIQALMPDLLVKGGDYKPDDIIGGDIVKEYGGEVRIVPLIKGFSTSEIIRKIKDADNQQS